MSGRAVSGECSKSVQSCRVSRFSCRSRFQPVYGGSGSRWVTSQPCQPCQPVRFSRVVSTASASQPVQPVVLTAPPISPVLPVLPVNPAHPAGRSHSSCPSRTSQRLRTPCPFFAFCHHAPPAHSAFPAAPFPPFPSASHPPNGPYRLSYPSSLSRTAECEEVPVCIN